MKKILSLLIIMVSIFTVFAQTTTESATTAQDAIETITTTSTDTLTQTIVEKGKLYTLTIDYTQSIDEAIFTYSINSSLFDQSEAMTTIRDRVETFIKEHGYYYYTYLGADITKYDNANELALYMSHFKFLVTK